MTLLWGEALRNKQLADEYWQEMLQMKKQETFRRSSVAERSQKSSHILYCKHLLLF